MNEFIEAAFTMPTAIFSSLMILVILYWATVILGLLDLGIFDSLFDLVDGLFDGVSGSVSGATEGLTEGVAEGLGEGLGESHGCLGLAGVPGSIIGSTLVFFAWALTFGGTQLLAGIATGTAAAAGLGVSAFALALGATSVALRPLRKVFRIAPVTGRRDLVGRTCTITTLRVDEKFGQAEVRDEGSAILIQARSHEPNNLSRGAKALIFQYDSATEVFLVTPMDGEVAKPVARSEPSG